MNLFSIVFKNMQHRALSSSLTGLSVALGVGLMVAVFVLNGVVTDLFRETGSGYDLVIGPKGSATQLILSTIYRIERPIENVPWRYYVDWTKDPRVKAAIPVNLGDTTEQGNFPIVGTSPQYFLHEYAPGKRFRVGKDEFSLRDTWDAVVGSEVARRNGWKKGSTFKLLHSGQDDRLHEEEFTIQGVLAATGTPNDRTAFVHIDGFFQMSDHSKPLRDAIRSEAEFYNETEEQVIERHKVEIDEILRQETEIASGSHHSQGPLPDIQKQVTSILLVLEGTDLQRSNRALTISSELKKGTKAMAANPVQVMEELVRNLLGNIQLAFLYLTGLIIAVSGIGIFVSIYNSMSDRRREIAVMRALGARRGTVFSLILLESVMICLLGGLAGILLGHGTVFIAAPILEARSGLLIDPLAFTWIELIVIPILIGMASLIGLLPGLTAYQTDVAEALQSS